MLSHSFAATPRRLGFVPRPVVAILALVLIIGGIAWVVQYLPSIKSKDPGPIVDKALLEFTPRVAIWKSKEAEPEKKDEDKKTLDGYRTFEQDAKGHYDFLFKNISGQDVEILHYQTACDCANMNAAVLSLEEHDRLVKAFQQDPGDPLPYANGKEPNWHELFTDGTKKNSLVVKANEAGVVRVGWKARKTPGQALNVQPKVIYRVVGTTPLQGFPLGVPIKVGHAVQFEPLQLIVGKLDKGHVVTKTINAWSSTRPKLDLKLEIEKLSNGETDPFFKIIETQALTKEECAELEETLKAKSVLTKVVSGARFTVEVRESIEDKDGKEGKQLELGAFHRRLLVHLNGELSGDIRGPEILGRVIGVLTIGGPDDHGRIRFPAFDRKDGGSKSVEIEAPADVKLEHVSCRPDWVQVKLTLDEKNMPTGKRVWRLDASVPRKEATRTFDEPDAVVLRITGPTMVRLVRIPIDGAITID